MGPVATRYCPACDIYIYLYVVSTGYGSFVELCVHYCALLVYDIAVLHANT